MAAGNRLVSRRWPGLFSPDQHHAHTSMVAAQLQTAMRRDPLEEERQSKIGPDGCQKIASPQSHKCGLTVEEGWLALPFVPPSGPLSIRAFHHAPDRRIGANMHQCCRIGGGDPANSVSIRSPDAK